MAVVVNSEKINISEELFNEMEVLVAKHNETRPAPRMNEAGEDKSYYFLSTGEKDNYYTLWFHNEPGIISVNVNYPSEYGHPIISERYLGNLSIDFKTAVIKALDHLKNSRYKIDLRWCGDGNHHYKYDPREFVMQWGKYKGEMISDVAKKDMNYLIWLKNNFVPKSELARKVLHNIEGQIDFYFDTIRKHNEETCTSKFVGNVKDKLTNVELKITRVIELKECDGMPATKQLWFVDDNDNIFTAYIGYGTKNYDLTFPVGLKIVVTKATIAGHYNKLGRNITRLNRLVF